MARIGALLTVLLTLLVGATFAAVAATAATGGGWAAATSAQTEADGEEADDGEAEVDDAAGADLNALCDLAGQADPEGEDAEDDPTDAESRAVTLEELLNAEEDEEDLEEEEPDVGFDCDTAPSGSPSGEAADGGTEKVSRRTVLKDGKLDTGSVALAGAGTVTQELWLNRSSSAPRAAAAAAKRPSNRGRILGGSVKRTVKKAGVVSLVVRLNTAARQHLRKAKEDVRITVKTITKVKGGKPRTRNGTIVVRPR